MATKSTRVIELEDGIAQAVAVLDAADGSRIGMQEAMDSSRETLGDVYGIGFEKAVSQYNDDDAGDDDGLDNDDDGLIDED